MKQLMTLVKAATPLLLLWGIIAVSLSIPELLQREQPEHDQSLAQLKLKIDTIKTVTSISFSSVDTTFEKVETTPFGKPYTPRKRVASGPKFEREPLRLQGILQGESPAAVLVDSKGKTHIVTRGDSVYDRKIIKISSTGVTLRDRKGTEVIAVQ